MAKKSLQSGVPMLRKAQLNKVSRIVDVGENVTNSPSFEAMREHGMLRYAQEDKASSTLDNTFFEKWWKSYPVRIVNGKKVKVGKSKAQKKFFNQIPNEKVFQQLMFATMNYSGLCNKLPKDAERFLLNDFWKEYSQEFDATTSTNTHVKETTSSDLDEMLRA